MVSKVYSPLIALLAVLGSFFTGVEIACHAAGYPAPVLAVPAATFAFMLARRPSSGPVMERLMSTAGFAVLAGASVWIGEQMDEHPVLGGAAFVVMMSGSVWGRRVTRLGAMVPLALISCLISSKSGPGSVSWWPICGWYALVGLGAFVWIGVVRWGAEKLTGVPGGPPPRPAAPARPRRQRHGIATHTRMAVQMAASLALAFSLGHLLFGEHWQWAVISAMVVNLGTIGRGDLALKGLERGLGAMIGTLIATVLAAAIDPRGTACVVAIFVVLFAASLLRPINYACYAAGVTTVLSLLYGYFGESAQHLLPIRLEALSLGAALAVAVGWFLLPIRANDALRLRLATTLGALGTFLEARREARPSTGALAAFDAAAAALEAGTRPHRLYQAVVRGAVLRGAVLRVAVPRGARNAGGATPADAGLALLAVRDPLHALAATGFGPRERATAKTVGLLRKALAAPADPLPELPPAAEVAPLSDLDGALRQLVEAIPALAQVGPAVTRPLPRSAPTSWSAHRLPMPRAPDSSWVHAPCGLVVR
jgi:Fusaric acid resistance protein-like